MPNEEHKEVQEYTTTLNRALMCITQVQLIRDVDDSGKDVLQLPDFVEVHSYEHKFFIDIMQSFYFQEIGQIPKLSTSEYNYSLYAEDGSTELILYHWHPGGEIVYPHLHVRADAAGFQSLTLHKMHLPTERIAIEDFIRFLITDLAIVPERDDWDDVLKATRIVFETKRTWPISGTVQVC